jgi:PST family polysaccharide transporter
LTTITDAVRRVSIAGFAKMEDQAEALKARFSSSLSTLLTAALPMIVAMALLATPLIGFLYGDQWLPSAPVLQVLVVLSFARMAIGFIFDLLVGVGRTRVTMALKVVWLVVLVPALMYGVRADDIQGVAIAHALVAGLIALPLFALAAQRAGADMVEVMRRMVRPLLAAVAAGVVGFLLRDHLGGRFTTLAAGGSVIVVAYLALVLRRGSIEAVRNWVRARRPTPSGTG